MLYCKICSFSIHIPVNERTGGPLPPPDVTTIDTNSLTAEFSKFAEAAARADTTARQTANARTTTSATTADPQATRAEDQTNAAIPPDFQNILAETMQRMAQNSQDFQVSLV